MKLLKERKPVLWLALAAAAVIAALLLGGREASSGASQQETRIAQVLSAMTGVGKVEVALFYPENPGGFSQSAPTGAVVVAQGAGDLTVRLSLIRAMRTLLGLPETAVDVFEMEEKQP